MAGVKKKSTKAASKKETSKPKAKRAPVKRKARKKASAATRDADDVLVKKIWLAGLGAYGLSRDKIQQRGDELLENGQQLFDSLVDRGTRVQDDTTEIFSQRVEELDNRIDEIRDQLKDGYSSSQWGQKINQIAKMLDDMQDKRK